ncbi:hypothetical protein ACHAWC_003126 [Mediolabrus comicus]
MNSRRQQKQKKPQQQQQQPPLNQTEEDLPPELSAFSLAAAIHEARTSSPTPPAAAAAQTTTSPSSKIRLPFFGRTSPLKKKNPSQVSLATNTSYNTANDAASIIASNNTPAVSYFVDSSEEDSDEETQETLSFGNDPLSVLSRTTDLKKPTEEISFNTSSEEYNPEVTMPSKKTSKKFDAAPVTATAVTADPPIPASTKKKEEDTPPHFDVAQNVYGCTKDIWAWGKTVPIISNMLGLTESVTAKVLDITIHMDLPSIDQNVVVPNFKKLDDEVITPAICTIWGIVNGGVTKGDEMIVKPVMTQVVPRILGPLGFLEDEKKEKNPIDSTPNPEVVPVLN